MNTIQLPQNDPNAEQRKSNLQGNQKIYRYKYDYQSLNGIAMADEVPRAESPTRLWVQKTITVFMMIFNNQLLVQQSTTFLSRLSNAFKVLVFDMVIFFLKYVLSNPGKAIVKTLRYLGKDFTNARDSAKRAARGTNRPINLANYDQYFYSLKMPEIAESYQQDTVFARMRVAGQNPIMLMAVARIDPSFPVTDALFQSVDGFAEDNLSQAIKDQRLYIADYVQLEQVKNGMTGGIQKYGFAPKALFAIPLHHSSEKTSLLPIAIQCAQTPDNHPIFTPSDGIAWNMAKTVVQIADFNHHELLSHLASTHLLIEPFVVSTHRQLADNHPLSKLLLPHFEGTIFINWAAQGQLVNDGGPVDKIFAGSMQANRIIVSNILKKSFNDELFPKKLKQRGVDNPKLIYPYRDDATSIWKAINEWVSGYLDIYYTNDQDVINDTELAAWGDELISAGQVVDFGNTGDGKIITLDYLKEAVTMVIFTCSAQHAAVNFTQQDFSGYPPNMPGAGYVPAPNDFDKTAQDHLNLLPPLNIADDQINLTYLLSGVYYTQLGQYAGSYFKDPKIVVVLDQFKATLEKIEATINQRNQDADEVDTFPYSYLLPSKIPQSINV